MEQPVVAIVQVETTANPLQIALQELLCRLHALYAVHRSAHWQVWGESYYGDHLLFQRLYEVLDDEIDKLAERMVQMMGPDVVDACIITAGTDALVQQWVAESPCPYDRGLEAEESLLSCVEEVMYLIEESGDQTLGWEDFLGSVASQHEEHVYLLQQRNQ